MIFSRFAYYTPVLLMCRWRCSTLIPFLMIHFYYDCEPLNHGEMHMDTAILVNWQKSQLQRVLRVQVHRNVINFEQG